MKKYLLQVIQDIFLLLLAGALFGFHLWGEIWHEWLAILFFSLIMLHCLLNWHWFKNAAKRNGDLFLRLRSCSTFALILGLIIAVASGLMLSQYLVPNVFFHNASNLIRKIHMTSVYWMQILLAVHLGMHWKMLSKFFSGILNIPLNSLFARRLMPTLFVVITGYGCHQLIARQIHHYLLMQVNYSFFDFDESKWIFYLDFLSIIIAVAYLTRILIGLVLWLVARVAVK
ncbi:DUF4405 domain-containing protein [Vibrio misgurnus]|uniref:DUF4405 domain-containing protein n=1 Tax=Vibrio misgurnus TaxID=2993714 RepID=UPI0023F7876C|nr:DUF4405 domain-containing protein [Vibrio sp. VCS]